MRCVVPVLVAMLAGCACGPARPDAGDAGPDGGAGDAGTSDGGGVADGGAPDAMLPGRFTIVGHSDLGARGMNAGLALHGDVAYVGARNDLPGIVMVDVSDPTVPTVLGAIAGAPGHSLREVRVIPALELLVAIELHCYAEYHACTSATDATGFLRVYDVSTPDAPALLESIPLQPDAHEMFLWVDPADPTRALLYLTTPPGPPALVVYEFVPGRPARRVAELDHPVTDRFDDEIHSIAISDDGRTGYVAHTGAGLLLVDTSELASGALEPTMHVRAVHDPSPPYAPAAHSFVPVPGRPIAITTDEVYPPPAGPGCPWGWARVFDVSRPDAITPLGELRLAENQPGVCTEGLFTAHNPTPLESIALVSWYAGGLRAVDLASPAAPRELAAFVPEPLARVAVEDPFLTGSRVMGWSYPIVRDGLVYLVDARNGLYVLRYEGPHEDEIASETFRDGSSSL